MPSPRPRTHTLVPPAIWLAEGLHFLDASYLVDDLLDGSTSPKVQGDQTAGQLGDAVLETASFPEPSEHLEGLAVLVHRYGDEETSVLGVQLCRRASQAAGSGLARPRVFRWKSASGSCCEG